MQFWEFYLVTIYKVQVMCSSLHIASMVLILFLIYRSHPLAGRNI